MRDGSIILYHSQLLDIVDAFSLEIDVMEEQRPFICASLSGPHKVKVNIFTDLACQ